MKTVFFFNESPLTEIKDLTERQDPFELSDNYNYDQIAAGKTRRCTGFQVVKVVNMTPHDVNIVGGLTYPKSGLQIRLAVQTVPCDPLPDGTPTSKTEFGEPEGLPEFREGIFYIVSQLVKNALPDRTDLLVPAEIVRDDAGVIIGAKSLGR